MKSRRCACDCYALLDHPREAPAQNQSQRRQPSGELRLCCSKHSPSKRQNNRGQPYKREAIERNAGESIKATPSF